MTHTTPPWRLSVRSNGTVHIGSNSVSHTLLDTEWPGPLGESDARRIVAAVNATADMTTEGLELIASGGYEARLALLASLMLQEIEAKAKKENDEAETGEYPLSRSDA